MEVGGDEITSNGYWYRGVTGYLNFQWKGTEKRGKKSFSSFNEQGVDKQIASDYLIIKENRQAS